LACFCFLSTFSFLFFDEEFQILFFLFSSKNRKIQNKQTKPKKKKNFFGFWGCAFGFLKKKNHLMPAKTNKKEK